MPPTQPFLIGVNMAGAVSAGAYTAGVLDFLIEALDAWYAAKTAGQRVPMHDVSIEVFSGASAGGMCAAIASVMVQGEFDHIHNAAATGTSNRFYETWVNKIDIQKLLGTDDLRNGGPVVSLLDCSIIDEIAGYALQPGKPKLRQYISPRLTLFLTLTNVTGIPYRLDPNDPGPLEEGTLFHTDRLRFQTVPPGGAAPARIAKPLPLGQPDQGAWGLLRETAKATGAFPVFLAPRILLRDKSDYDIPLWESVNPAARSGNEITPAWPERMPEQFPTLNVDGGVIDNDPFDLAHDYVASINPGAVEHGTRNPREPDKANAGIVTVAPFPSTAAFNRDPTIQDGVVSSAVGKLASVLITQSRFFGESLALIANRAFSRYLIAPSDDSVGADTPALQCAALGAFGGFFAREFRAHDFMLGRRNCQQFLRRQFILPLSNPIIRDGLAPLGPSADAFRTQPPKGADPALGMDWFPLIPLVSKELQQEIRPLPRQKLGAAELRSIVDLIYERGRVVVPALAKQIPSLPVRTGVDLAEEVIGLFGLGKAQLTEFLAGQLGDSVAKD